MKTAFKTAVVIFLLSAVAQASSIPQLVNYQGKLTDPGGAPIHGTKTIEFNIYDAATNGSLVWGPQIFSPVPIEQGYFNVILSQDTAGKNISAAFSPIPTYSDERYFEIKVDTDTIAPRQQILSAPYAVQAAETGLARSVAESSITGANLVNNTIGVAKLEGYDSGTNTLKLSGQVGAQKFCDENGQNCKSITEILSWDPSDMESYTPPLKFKLQNPDVTTWVCETRDLEPWCGDEDGCTIRLQMQHETNKNDVRTIDFNIYAKSYDGDPNHAYVTSMDSCCNRSAGTTGAGSSLYQLLYPWEWVYAGDFCETQCTNCGTHNVSYDGPYQFTFRTHPHVSTIIIVYDR